MNTPVAKQTLHHRMLNELSAIDSDLAGLDSILQVCGVALTALDDEEAGDVSVVLATVVRRIRTAQHDVTNAINLLPELLQVERAS